jgi:hypothetical protein
VVDAEHARHRVEHARGVERADQRQEAAGRVGEPGDRAGPVARPLVGDGGDDAGRADGDDEVAGAGAQAEGGGRVVAGARTEQRAGGRAAGSLGGPSTRGTTGTWPRARSSRSGRYSPVVADQ